MGFNNIQTFPRTSKSVGVYNKTAVSLTTISLEILMPQDLYRVYALFTRLRFTFTDTTWDAAKQFFATVNVSDGASWSKTRRLNAPGTNALFYAQQELVFSAPVPDGYPDHIIEIQADLADLLNPTGRNIITFTFDSGAFSPGYAGSSGTVNLWKADMLYSTIGNR